MSFELSNILNDTINQFKVEFKGTDIEFDKKIQKKLPEMVQSLGDTFKKVLLEQYKSDILPNIEDQIDKYKTNLYTDYKEAFDLFQIFIDINKYCGKRTLEELEKDQNYNLKKKHHIIFRIQSRSCQIASEILTLLRNGYPDGAQARWRTMHELAVILIILNESPDKTTEMFIDYGTIEKYKQSNDFEHQRHKIEWPALDVNQLTNLKDKRVELINKYGKEFANSYGWTKEILPKGRRNFRELEKLSGIDYMRPFYSWANDNIHSSITGLISRRGQIESGRESYLNLAGPSYYGFGDPAQFTITTLRGITSIILELYDDLENQVFDSLIYDLDGEIKEAFFDKQKEFKIEYYKRKSAHNSGS